MFVDIAEVVVKAGNGGKGVVSFRHEIYVDRGGPDGGDGGDGGSVYFEATNNINALQSFRYKQLLAAEDGSSGAKQRKHGRSGADKLVHVPIGTVVIDPATGEILADLAVDGQKECIATGGKGGFGNAHFKSSRRQAPKIAEVGEKTKPRELKLELKLLADVGLVGLPNAGKSTFLGRISNAKPEVADYPFTTLRPHLGVADIDDTSLLVADIPGLIEGASEGKGLGDEFLRHVERTEVLLHLIDSYSDDIIADFQTIRAELAGYQVDLSNKPFIVALTKTDGLDADIVKDQIDTLKTVYKEPVFAISSHDGAGVKQLLRTLSTLVSTHRERSAAEEADEETPSDTTFVTITDTQETWDVHKVMAQVFEVTGAKIEGFAARTDFENEWGVARLKDIMKKKGILHDLVRKGAKSGDTIKIGDNELEL